MTRSTFAHPLSPYARTEAAIALAVLVFGVTISFVGIQSMRSHGSRPQFYQYNFGPAVIMACGHGFATTTTEAAPASLIDFLNLRRDRFDCADLPAPLPLQRVTWNGTWYYLYAATALVWRVAGISWKALDWLAALLGGFAILAQYGLFRLVGGRIVAFALTLLVMLSQDNVTQLMMLRDYSKAPFVLASVFLLAVLVITPMRRGLTLALAAAFGAVVGLGYGFRSDLLIMVPFGIAVIALLLPGDWREQWRRNAAAAAVAVVAFLIVAWPPLRGLETGGCQFHYSLLGLTSPFTRYLGLQPPIYNFGDHFLDAFIDLKVGDYGHRMMGMLAPNLCAPEYDQASGQLFKSMATMFPADLIVRAYGAVLTILRDGVIVTPVTGSTPLLTAFATRLFTFTRAAAVWGPVITALAVAVAWNAAPRLGIALTAFVLFLAGYPAIEFETRHWFHLRFLPWWAAALVVQALVQVVRSRAGDWSLRRAAGGFAFVASLAIALALSLAAARVLQQRRVAAMVDAYLAAPIEPLPTSRPAPSAVAVDWHPLDYAVPPMHRSSDLMVVEIAADGCTAARAVDVVARYTARLPTHDMSSTITVMRGASGSSPTQLFVPVFALGLEGQPYLRFSGIDVRAVSSDCITRVARVTDRQRLPLWVQLQAPPDWRDRRLYQTLDWSRLVTTPQ